MKTIYISIVLALISQGCTSTQKEVQINNIPAKTTHVKAEAPGTPSYRWYPGSRYYHNYYYDGRYYDGYYYNHLGNGPLTFQGSPEDVDNHIRGLD